MAAALQRLFCGTDCPLSRDKRSCSTSSLLRPCLCMAIQKSLFPSAWPSDQLSRSLTMQQPSRRQWPGRFLYSSQASEQYAGSSCADVPPGSTARCPRGRRPLGSERPPSTASCWLQFQAPPCRRQPPRTGGQGAENRAGLAPAAAAPLPDQALLVHWRKGSAGPLPFNSIPEDQTITGESKGDPMVTARGSHWEAASQLNTWQQQPGLTILVIKRDRTRPGQAERQHLGRRGRGPAAAVWRCTGAPCARIRGG